MLVSLFYFTYNIKTTFVVIIFINQSFKSTKSVTSIKSFNSIHSIHPVKSNQSILLCNPINYYNQSINLLINMIFQTILLLPCVVFYCYPSLSMPCVPIAMYIILIIYHHTPCVLGFLVHYHLQKNNKAIGTPHQRSMPQLQVHQTLEIARPP